MWQKFTERARRVIFFSQEEAGMLGESDVTTAHVLLGMLRDTDCIALRILDRLDVSPAKVKATLLSRLTRGSGNLGKDMVLTSSSKRVLDLAKAATVELGVNYIGTEHLLLGLIREGEGLAAKVLLELNATEARLMPEIHAAMEEAKTQLLRPPAGWFLVLLQHQGDGNGRAVPIQVTHDAREAVVTARHIDNLGYGVVPSDCVTVYCLVPGQAYQGCEGHLVILSRCLTSPVDGTNAVPEWVETWGNPTLEVFLGDVSFAKKSE